MQSVIISGEGLSIQEVTGNDFQSGQSGKQQCWLHQIKKLGGRKIDASNVQELYPLTFVEEGADNVVCESVDEVVSHLNDRYEKDGHGGFTANQDHFLRDVVAQGIILPLNVPVLTQKDADTPFHDEFVVHWEDGSICQVNKAKSYPMQVRIGGRLNVTLNQPADWYLKVVYGLEVPPHEITGYSIGSSSGRENLVFWEVPYKHDTKTPTEITVTKP